MSLVDSLLNVMHMNPDDDEDYYDEDYEDEEEDEEELPRRRSRTREPEDYRSGRQSSSALQGSNQPIDINRNRDRSTKNNSKVTPMRPSKKNQTGMEVCVIKPTSFEDAREITETLLMNRPVILNVEGLDVDVAQRIIDFSSGSCFAINGNLQKISNYIFIITPANVEISGDFQGLLDSYGASPLKTGYYTRES